MFTPQIVKFENQLETLSSKIQELGRALLTVNGKLDRCQLIERLENQDG